MASAQWHQRIERWAAKNGVTGSYDEKAAAWYQDRGARVSARRGLTPGTTEAKAAQRGRRVGAEHGYREFVAGGSVIYAMRSTKHVEKILERVDRLDQGSRAGVNIKTRDGKTVRLFANKGHSRGYSVSGLAKLAASGNFGEAVADAIDSPDLTDLFADATEIQIEVF